MQLIDLGILCALGADAPEVWQNALRGSRAGMQPCALTINQGEPQIAGQVNDAALPPLQDLVPAMATRNNQLAAAAYAQIATTVDALRQQYGAERIAVIIGSSTSGIREGEAALAHYQAHQQLPDDFYYGMQEMYSPAEFIADLAGVSGPAYSISTACSSSARALMSARAMLRADLADVVIVGGVDSLCRLTLNGFHALESISASYCRPFSRNRDGINIGEGAALFVATKDLTTQPSATKAPAVTLTGAGHSSDAYHMTAPEPRGRGAIAAITTALADAGISPQQLGYINLHGTGTPLNDAMESNAITAVGAAQVAASSTKALTGHTLGAAGAIEAGLCWLALRSERGELPLHVWDNQIDPELAPISLYDTQKTTATTAIEHCLSNSFAFGGNNVALVFSKAQNGE
ncbi:beta-ketoacyl-ACP synthase [Pseudidiomarina halophila]|uniref:Beta-ketoacyl-[acyl-carrier-protein] synthase II n=1 Tax=Pseudidiomarina halophila TaxID=1449799 RepID=A0A432XVJ4_9GAMM|nr:beta-ketoacyl-ACP synthase [Pseudidiomarina halophila]RUO52747.1 beta-ketoacyl-[acyl-carrier-protein] synthase II [Pseudidiomarina halophila]